MHVRKLVYVSSHDRPAILSKWPAFPILGGGATSSFPAIGCRKDKSRRDTSLRTAGVPPAFPRAGGTPAVQGLPLFGPQASHLLLLLSWDSRLWIDRRAKRRAVPQLSASRSR